MIRFYIAVLLCFFMVLSASASASTVKVRAGIHERFNRLVFDWNDASVKYSINQQMSRVTLQFNRAAQANLVQVNNVAPPFMLNFKQVIKDKKLEVSFDVPQNTRVQGFKVERNLAFDVLLLKKGKLDFAPTATPIKQEPDNIAQQKQQTDLNPEAAETTETISPPAVVKPKAEPAPQIVAEKPADKPAEPNIKLDPRQINAVILPPSDAMLPEETVIQLQPAVETRLAVWQRGHKLWLVLDKPAADLPIAVQGALVQNFSHPYKFETVTKTHTAFVFDLPTNKKIALSFKSVNNRWHIQLSTSNANLSPANAPASMPPSMVVQLQNNVLTLFAGDQPTVASFTDPTLGDILTFIPVRRPESRVAINRAFAAFTLPQTILGAVVVSPQNLAITAALDKVEINLQGQQTLGFSEQADQTTALKNDNTDNNATNNASNSQDFALWPWPSLSQPQNSVASRQLLETKISQAKAGQDKAVAFVQLARYLLSQGRGPEAGGVLRLAALEKANLATTVPYRVLAGIEAAMRAQTTLASEFFNHPTIMAQPAANLWLAYSLALNENWRQARQAFSLSQSGAGTNPTATLSPTLKAPLLLAMAEADLMAQDLSAAQQQLNKLTPDMPLTSSQMAAKTYLISTIQQAAQQPKKSQQTLEALSKGPDQLYRIKAQLQLIDRQQNQPNFDRKNTIQTLEKMRYSWRGDQLEIRILETLGNLYVADKRFFDGLTTWREAASLATDQTDTDRLATQMGRVFADLFVRNGADAISPLQALALYERFKELTPTGADGVVAQRQLAKRLQRVDLLDQADQILQGVLQQQPLGKLAATIGADLAQIRIKNRQPAQALKALDDSTPQALPEALPQALQEQRYYLRARALADAGKGDDALAMLSNATTEQGLSLASDLLWAVGRWDDAAVELGKLLQLYPNANQSATKDLMQRRADVVLRQAIALTLAGDQMGLVTLTQTEQDFMAASNQAQSFKMITQSGSNGKLADLPTLQKYLNDVTLFEKFLQSDSKFRGKARQQAADAA